MSTNSFIYEVNIVSNMSEIIDITYTANNVEIVSDGKMTFTCSCGATVTALTHINTVCECGGIYGVVMRLIRNDVDMKK